MIRNPIFPFSRLAGPAAALAFSICTSAVYAAPAVTPVAAAANATVTGTSGVSGASDLTGTAAVQAEESDPDADLKAQRLPHQENITMIEYERRAWQRDLAKREDQCLKRFFSSGCINDLRKEHLKEMRGYDLRKEAELQAIRDIDAEIRQRVRARKAAQAESRSSTEKPAKPADPTKADGKGQP